MANIKKTDLTANYATCATGLTANYPSTQTWVFATKTYTRGDILNMLQAAITAAQTTKAAHDAWLAAVTAEQVLLAETRPVLGALHKSLEAQWGATSNKLTEFGYVPEKPLVRTAASKAAAAAKAKLLGERPSYPGAGHQRPGQQPSGRPRSRPQRSRPQRSRPPAGTAGRPARHKLA